MGEIQFVLPQEIEKRSFEMIEEELLNRKIMLKKEEEPVIKRVIHTTADFEYADTMIFSKDAVNCAVKLIKEGAHIITDTNMVLAGINKKVLKRFGGEVHCFMAEESVAKKAGERNVTRAYVSMEEAVKIKKPLIFAIGNAPTALIRLSELYQENVYKPDFVIGVPVGFVNVIEAKELIIQSDIPHIVNRGRKGGSNIAAAICNAILYEMGR